MVSIHRGLARLRICLPEHLVARVTGNRRMQRDGQWRQLGLSGRWAHRLTVPAISRAAVADITGTLASPA